MPQDITTPLCRSIDIMGDSNYEMSFKTMKPGVKPGFNEGLHSAISLPRLLHQILLRVTY